MKLNFENDEVSVGQGETNTWLSFNPLIPTLKQNEQLQCKRITRATAESIMAVARPASDFEHGYEEVVMKTVFGELDIRPTYDRHLLKKGEYILQVRGEGELGEYVFELLYIEEIEE